MNSGASLALPPPIVAAVSPLRLALVGTLFSFVWSSAFIAGKVGMSSTGPLTLLSLRFLLAGALIWLLGRSLGWGISGRAAPGQGRLLLIALAAACSPTGSIWGSPTWAC